MIAGKMRHRVTVQAYGSTDDSFGEPVPAWTSLGTYWAEVRPLAGREAIIGQQIRADNTHAVTMRRMAGVVLTPKHRLLFQGRVLNITQVNDVGERRRELAILCTEVTTP